MHYAIKQTAVDDDLLVIAGYGSQLSMCCPSCHVICRDTLFYQDFSLTDFIKTFHNLQLIYPQGCSLVTYSTCSNEGNLTNIK